MREVKILLHLCWFEAQRFRAYPLEILASVFSRLAEAALFITFWVIISRLSSRGHINTRDIVAYYLIVTNLTPFFYTGFGIGSAIIDQVKSGRLSQTLMRPASPLLYPWANRTGRNLINLIFGAIGISIGMIISGGIHTNALPFLVPVLLNTFAINAALNIVIGTSSFYFTEAHGIKNSVHHIAAFARGERMPLYLMSPGLAHFLQLTPLPASQYHLTLLLQGTRLPGWSDVWIGSLWGVALLTTSILFWRYSLKHYEAVGL